ncbi:hypothetical protein B7P34_12030 [Streptosporangium nondiastaticum]|uniref:Uncharacterized protein n=1 Tax=Streptosporangium nondiastaticum TaxID=35764 RepID=A0A9X7PHS8_9ACTN|nr:hypothetical protein [Streptosporangium nondiastaticum]PSJ28465.1 hypothetical protein B7P34_12030 [Streptosporangium nondiastaticum]
MTDQGTTAETTSRVREETKALLRDRSRPEPTADADVLRAMADDDRESVALISRATARGCHLGPFEVAAFQQRHA